MNELRQKHVSYNEHLMMSEYRWFHFPKHTWRGNPTPFLLYESTSNRAYKKSLGSPPTLKLLDKDTTFSRAESSQTQVLDFIRLRKTVLTIEFSLKIKQVNRWLDKAESYIYHSALFSCKSAIAQATVFLIFNRSILSAI